MLNLTAQKVIADNVVVMNGVEIGRLTDADARRLITIINGMTSGSPVQKSVSNSQTSGKVLHLPEEPKTSKPEAGKKFWQENFMDITEYNGEYRVYINCPIGGEKGKKIRYAIKHEIYQYGGKFTGDPKNNDYFWTLPDKESAIAFRTSRKAYAEAHKQEGK